MRKALASAAVTAFVVLAAAGCGSSASGTSSDPVKLKFSTFVNKNTVPGQTFTWWADQVEKRTGGKVKIERYFDGSLVPAADTLGALQDGRVDLAPATEIYSPAELPLSQVAGIPFTTQDPEAEMKALTDLYDSNQDFKKQYEKAGAHVLFFLPIGTSTISTDKAVSSLAQLKGLKIRAGGQAAVALQTIGAVPQNIQIPDVYNAIQRGTIDGISGLPLDTLVGTGLQEVAPHVMSDGLGEFATSAQSINVNKWKSLPASVQKVMDEVSKEAVAQGVKILTEANKAACAKLGQTKGAQVTQLPEDQVASWKDQVGDTVVKSWKGAATKAGYSSSAVDSFYDAYSANIEKYDGQGDYDEKSAYCQ